jgi:uncharacterized membrane protein YhiD involved in acid resistance
VPIATQLEMLGEVALAMALGALIGLERELAHKAAGLRTHMLVAGAAAMLVGLVDALLHRFLLPAISPLVRADPVPVITAAVGSAVGLRQFVLTIGAAILAVATLRGVMLLENKLRRRAPDSSGRPRNS